MSKYFHNDDIQFIESEEIEKILKRADKKPENYIRIALNEKHMRIDNKTKLELDIIEAVIFHFKENGQIIRYDFKECESSGSFYAVIDTDNFMAVSIDDANNPLENIFMFDSEESVFCILKAPESSVYILYDGTADHVGYGFIHEKAGYPPFFKKFLHLFNVTVPKKTEKEKEASKK